MHKVAVETAKRLGIRQEIEKDSLSGNEAIALGAWEAGVRVGSGYPGTPSTEIMEKPVRL